MSFTSMKNDVLDMWRSVRSMNTRDYAQQAINLAMIVFSALMLWKGLMVVTGSDSPVVVVLSGSMEPAYYRGDILFLWLGQEPFRVGEVVVFKIKGRDIPIVHRVLEIHQKFNATSDALPQMNMLTKGDNNEINDRGLYLPGQAWIQQDDIVGRAKLFLPYLGIITILLNDYPALKYVMIGLMAIFAFTTKEG